MSGVKIYRQVDRQNAATLFGISRMEDIYDRRHGVPDEAHRHTFYTVILAIEASGMHIIDFHKYPLRNGQVYFVAPGQVHQIIEDRRPRGYSIVFSPEFLASNNIPLSVIDDLNLFLDYGEAPPLLPSKMQLDRMEQIAEQMIHFETEDLPFTGRAHAALLELFLITSNHCCARTSDPHKQETANNLLRSFKGLVETHHTEHHDLAFYAERLHITSDHLNRSIRGVIDRTAKEYIQSRLTIAAKRMLLFTDLSVKEVGFHLGFSESSNFNAFFKKCTGMAPGVFRKKQR